MKKLIIYDLDGTLADTREDIVQAMNFMLTAMNAPALDRSEITRFVGRGLYHLVASCLRSDDPKRIEKGAKIYRGFYAQHMLDNTVLYPGACEILEYFKNQLQAVITNKPNPFSQQILEALKVAHYFVDIVAGDSNYPKKPDPTAVLSIMKRENILKENTLFIGDSAVDIETGNNAGIQTVVITHGFESEDELKSANPHAIFHDFKGLLEFLKKQGW